jgi:hypothetical protein
LNNSAEKQVHDRRVDRGKALDPRTRDLPETEPESDQSKDRQTGEQTLQHGKLSAIGTAADAWAMRRG